MKVLYLAEFLVLSKKISRQLHLSKYFKNSLYPVMGFRGFVRTRSWRVVIISEPVLVFCYRPWTTAANGFSKMREPVVSEFDTKENLFLKF